MAYPEAAAFFIDAAGRPMGITPPCNVDLLIDLTGANQRQSWGFARGLRSRAKVVVGRDVSWFRRFRYDRVLKTSTDEAVAQRQVLELAGIPSAHSG